MCFNYMEPKFNSLFNDSFDESTEPDFYPINKIDDTLITSTILLTFDKEKLKYNEVLNKRNYGDSNDYRLGPRPCSTRHASSEKFCEYPGLPEVYEEKKQNNCNIDFMPNSSIGNRNQYLKNIDLEHKILKMDYKDSKCDKKNEKEDMCNPNDLSCVLNCQKNIFKNDDLTIKRDTGLNQIIYNNRIFCNYRKDNFQQIKNDFLTFQPTKRINTVNW